MQVFASCYYSLSLGTKYAELCGPKDPHSVSFLPAGKGPSFICIVIDVQAKCYKQCGGRHSQNVTAVDTYFMCATFLKDLLAAFILQL